jgi:hypothetical protein
MEKKKKKKKVIAESRDQIPVRREKKATSMQVRDKRRRVQKEKLYCGATPKSIQGLKDDQFQVTDYILDVYAVHYASVMEHHDSINPTFALALDSG